MVSFSDVLSIISHFYILLYLKLLHLFFVQEVNENSLKRLNGYLENLQKPGSNLARPVELTFYVRDTKENTEMQPAVVPSGTVCFVLLLHWTLEMLRFYLLKTFCQDLQVFDP